jgi:hypothetical protein
VHIAERAHDALGQRKEVLGGHGLARMLLERLAFEGLVHDRGRAAPGSERQRTDDARAVDSPGHLVLVAKPIGIGAPAWPEASTVIATLRPSSRFADKTRDPFGNARTAITE